MALTPKTVFVVASTLQAARDELLRLRNQVDPATGQPALPEGTDIVAVFKDTDMRGRVVSSGDIVLVVGDWSLAPAQQVRQLITMFNSRRQLHTQPEAPSLVYRPGEAPEVTYTVSPMPESNRIQFGAGTMWFNASTSMTTTNDPLNNQYAIGIETTVPPTAGGASSFTDTEVLRLTDELKAAKETLARNDTLVSGLVQQVKQLQSWLSGVLPVEDPDFPEIHYCAICSVRIPNHKDGCPAAPGMETR